MSITAQLRASARLPGGVALINGAPFERTAALAPCALLRNGHELEVHALEDLFAGESAPSAVFPLPWPSWDRGVDSVSPDGSFAVFSGQRAVRAVSASGETLWEHRHGCWGSLLGHPHTGDDQQVCDGLEHGSCRISDDGRLVWAHVALGSDKAVRQEAWLVLDARDGHELARLALDSAAAGSHQLAHPDGRHMGLCIGLGQDGILLHWARWDGEKLTAWDVNEDMDRILADVHEAHPGFLTIQHYGSDLRLHALDGTVLAEAEPSAPESENGADSTDGYEEDDLYWDYFAGFVDAGTVIASTVESADGSDRARHWLLDAATLRLRGPVGYPTGPNQGYARALGDGTWITYDERDQTLRRWAEAPGTEDGA
ncbi:hypothetical protein GTY65_04485 [Streptomyces sp. SID8379]|uniref:hypothetical protein n=1 Tax=unclassified Streptomyces TaxID=2593676 RepID=UPI0003809D1E|nr:MULTISPECIES: hypothetical protein [unclassified Streptomyces]MYW63338.1 hypothetical protein [Streptomyces sp. SID8379]